MNLQSNDFELFGLPQQYAQDWALVESRWKELQKMAHPDRFASEGAAAQRVAMQWSVRINEAHQRLKDPLKRAAYLCEMRGAPIGAHDNTAMPPDFLIQQMAWREALDDAQHTDELEALYDQTQTARSGALADIERSLDQQASPAEAAQAVRRLMFIERFAHEVQERLDRLSA